MIVKTHIYDLFTKETFLGRPYYPRAGPWKKRRKGSNICHVSVSFVFDSNGSVDLIHD